MKSWSTPRILRYGDVASTTHGSNGSLDIGKGPGIGDAIIIQINGQTVDTINAPGPSGTFTINFH